MKSYIFPAILALIFAGCANDDSNGVKAIRSEGGPNAALIRNPATADMPLDTNQLAKIVFEEDEFDFGTIKKGDIVEDKYKFTNTGKVPLLILNARSSCGCTTPAWPEDPIPPGGTGEITAKFNSDGRTGDQKKLIMVTANTYPNETRVKLQAHVE